MQIPDLFNLLRNSPIFGFLEDELLKEIEHNFILKCYSIGDKIVSKEFGDSGYYIVFSGSVEVILEDGIKHKRVSTLKRGDSFGEQSIISGNKLDKTFIANSDLVLAFLSQELFTDLINTKKEFSNFVKTYIANNALQVFLKNFGSFGGLSKRESAKWLSGLTFEEPRENGEIIFNEGDEGDKFYIVTSGGVNITKIINGEEKLLVTLGEGKFFGEMALISNAPRAASVRSVGITTLISMDKQQFTKMLDSNPILSTKIKNIVDMYKASSVPKDAFIQTKNVDKDEYKITSDDLRVDKNSQIPFIFESANSPITAALSCINIISSFHNTKFNKAIAFEIIKSTNFEEIADILNDTVNLKSSIVEINPEDIKRIKNPFIVNIDGSLSVVYENNGSKFKVATPQSGIKEFKYNELKNIISSSVIIIEPPIKKSFDEQKLTFFSFLGILLPYKRVLTEIFITSIFISFLSLLPPIFVRILIDDVIVNKNEDMLFIIITALIVIAIFTGMLIALRAYLQFYLEGKLQVAILGRFYRHLISLPMSFFLNKHSGTILSDFGDGKDAEKFFVKTTLVLLIDGTTAVALLLAIFVANTKLFLTFFFFVFIMGGFIFLYTYIIRKYIPKTLSKDTKTDEGMLESIKNIMVIKAFCGENFSRNSWEKKYINKLSNNNKYIMINTISNSAVTALKTLTVAVLLGYGSIMALNNEISIGEALAINMVAMLALAPIGNLIQIYNDINTALFYSSGLNKIYAIEQEWNKEEQQKENLILQTSNIEFKKVSFSYDKNSKQILKNFSLFIPDGKYTAIVGRIGSGKSSLVNLLTRMVDVDDGEVLIDNKNISQVNLKSLRNSIGVVFQEPYIFAGTIKDNIGFGTIGVTIAQIIEAATLVGAHDFIVNMKNGYDTVLGENGAGLSGGQKRLLAVARALVSNPSILIMDEPTNDFDTETEQIFKDNLKTIAYGRTLIIITHRPMLIRDADQIALIDDGEIVETGKHDELISKRGYYFYLSAKQLTVS